MKVKFQTVFDYKDIGLDTRTYKYSDHILLKIVVPNEYYKETKDILDKNYNGELIISIDGIK